jgi:hypothetical protein
MGYWNHLFCLLVFIRLSLSMLMCRSTYEADCRSSCMCRILYDNWDCNKYKTTGVTGGWGTINPSWSPYFTSSFCGIRIAQSLIFLRIVFANHCLPFVLFLFAILPIVQLHSFQPLRYNPSYQSCMREGPTCDYDKRNISVVICEKYSNSNR